MKKWILVALTCTFFSSSYAVEDKDVMAKELINNWFAAMKNHDLQKAGSYLAPEFVSIHTDGKVRNKAQEMDLIKNLHMESYKLTNFKFSNADNTIVVTYKDQGSEMIDSKNIAPKAAGRMAVLQKQGSNWLILAYANLDKIG